MIERNTVFSRTWAWTSLLVINDTHHRLVTMSHKCSAFYDWFLFLSGLGLHEHKRIKQQRRLSWILYSFIYFLFFILFIFTFTDVFASTVVIVVWKNMNVYQLLWAVSILKYEKHVLFEFTKLNLYISMKCLKIL